MKWLLWVIGILVIIAIGVVAYRKLPSHSRILADVSSPSDAWRVVVNGKDVMSGVEVSATVHTNDGRAISRGVIDLRPEWRETEYFYQAHEALHTRIDEVKAVVGDNLLFRDDYFPGQDFAVTGTLADKPVKLRIGTVDNMGFHFMSGLRVGDGEKVSVQFIDFPSKLVRGKVFSIQASAEDFIIPGIAYYWRDPESDMLNVVGHNKNFSLNLVVDQVSDFVVTGTVRITGTDPNVDLAGDFRLVNKLPVPHADRR